MTLTIRKIKYILKEDLSFLSLLANFITMQKFVTQRTRCPTSKGFRSLNYVACIALVCLISASTSVVHADEAQVSNDSPKSAKDKAWEEKIEKSATNLAE